MYLMYINVQTYTITKKRDCTIAVPLIEALALPFVPNKQHRSPRRYVCIRAHYVKVRAYGIYISRGHQNAAMCWNK